MPLLLLKNYDCNDSFADDHDQQLTANDVTNKVIRDMKTKFRIYDILVGNHWLRIIDWMLKLQKNSAKA